MHKYPYPMVLYESERLAEELRSRCLELAEIEQVKFRNFASLDEIDI